ncbi:Hsp70 family protein [Nocardia abscessus]|uniref:Hsp70 family protein n=1 Tax=Nocardia abscessus TaxID=120957 RepID=A0ABS0C0U6_9NOCA|nr:Hsp70 family protein [Nocardia abscessus]MBF6224005.1 Hsp70 family protein [Nocardia abscessus]
MNSVTASVSAERPRPAVRSRRTAVTFDSAGGLRLGGIPQFSTAVTDFADLGRDPDTVTVGGRIWSPANLVAAVVNELRAVEPEASQAGVVTTYPAMYSDKQVALLRQALDLSGGGDVLLVPEPVAAAEWLEHEHGPLRTGFVLIYDLGGTSLDVSIVRVGPDWDNHPMIGKPVRSYDFGGRPLGAMIARYAPDVSAASAGLSMTSIVDIDGLRVTHIQDSLQLVRDCVRAADITLSDIGCILLVGGASRPAEVARALAELGRPVVISSDPGQTVAAGAALMAARTMALGASGERAVAPRFAVFSSAAVVSAVAMSAVTVFGGPTVPELSPMLERLPDLAAPSDSLLVDVGSERLADAWSWRSAPTTRNSGRALPAFLSQRTSAYTRFITPAPRSAGYGPSMAESQLGSHPRNCCAPRGSRYGGYGDPAYFVNPLPFGPVVRPAPGDVAQPPTPDLPGLPPEQGTGLPAQPPAPGQIPAPGAGTPPVGTPGSTVPAPQNGSTPAETGPGSGGTAPGNSAGAPSSGTSGSPAAGAASGEHGGSSGTSSSGDSSSGGTGGSSSGDGAGTSSSGTSSGGSSSGGTASTGGSTSDPSANGSSDGSAVGSSSGSNSSSHGSSSGGSGGNSSSHGSSSGGSGGNSSSHGSSSGGSGGNSSSHGSSSGGSGGNSSSHGSSSGGSGGNSSSHGSSSGGSGGNSSSHGSSSGGPGGNSSTHGSSSGGSAGNSSGGSSSSGGSASGGRAGGASSSAGGNSSGASSSSASSSSGSRGRSGSVGGSSAGGSSAGGAGGGGRGR